MAILEMKSCFKPADFWPSKTEGRLKAKPLFSEKPESLELILLILGGSLGGLLLSAMGTWLSPGVETLFSLDLEFFISLRALNWNT